MLQNGMNKFVETLKLSLSLISSGRLKDALVKLNEGLECAIQEKDSRWAASFSRNAALLYEQGGKLDKARDYFKISLKHDKSNPYIYHALGDIYMRLGKRESARRYFNSCYELAKKNGDADLLYILSKTDFKKLSKKK
jgi:Tfp pilus assembly protein PilF